MDNGGAFTDRLFDNADIQAGDIALDIGCGTGDMTFRLAERVGASGQVVGIDLNEDALEKARNRAQQDGINNAKFMRADLHDIPNPETKHDYDVVACRRVLMYIPDKVQALRCMLGALRPGGKLILQEHNASLSASSKDLPLNTKVQNFIWETVRAEGADTALGLKLHGLIVESGGIMPKIIAESVVQTPEQSAPTAMILEAMTERIIEKGIATREEIEALNLETLNDRLIEERQEKNASYIGEVIFGVTAQKPV